MLPDGSATWCLSRSKAVREVNDLLYSNAFLPILALLAVIGHVLEIEMAIYWIYTLLALFCVLFGRDLLLLFPLTVCCYIMPSAPNNPGKHAESIFFWQNGAYQFAIMGGLIFMAVLFRMILDHEIGFRNVKRTHFALLGGLLVLGLAYLLSGVGSEEYAKSFPQNLFFALLQFVSVFALYFLLSFSVKWELCDRRYWFYVVLLMGGVICVELLWAYYGHGVFHGATLNKADLYVGWGISNNIGVLLAFALPAAFYLVRRGEHPLLYNAVAILFFAFSVLSMSRAAILGAGALWVACAALVILRGESKRARRITLVVGVLCLGGGAVAVILLGVLSRVFADGLGSWSRVQLYRFGWRVFGENPLTGTGFFGLNEYGKYYYIWEKLEAFSAGFPDRWHSTVIQLLASCGLVGICAYAFHRYQSVKMLLCGRNMERLWIGASVAVLLGLSLIDCHFFNVGPTLIYSATLAFAENMALRR